MKISVRDDHFGGLRPSIGTNQGPDRTVLQTDVISSDSTFRWHGNNILDKIVWSPLKVVATGSYLPYERKARLKAIIIGVCVDSVFFTRGDVRSISIQGYADGVSLELEFLRCMNTNRCGVSGTCRKLRGGRHVLVAHSINERTRTV